MSEAQNGGNVMERLTYRDKDGFPMMKKRGGFKQGGVERLAAYEDTGRTPEEIDMDHEAAETLRQLCRNCDLDRLEELAEADRDGRVVVLPCKMGDGLWTFCTHPVEQVYSFTVTDISTLNGRTMLNTSRCGVIDARDVGKTVFRTREEAEEAMKDG